MNDLYTSMMLMTALSAAAFIAGRRLSTSASLAKQGSLQAATLVLMAVYLRWIWDQPFITRLLPFSGLVILGNWLPLFASFLAGSLCEKRTIPAVRRVSLTLVTMGVGAYSLMSPMLGEAPLVAGSLNIDPLQFQTNGVTCSPSSAASLLRLHGIDAGEREMAELCLTRRGTHWLGVYRALKLKTEGTAWDVAVDQFDPHEKLPSLSRPAVLSLTFDKRFGERLQAAGFEEDTGHTVLLLSSRSDGSVEVFDPAPEFGLENWQPDLLSRIETGILLSLVPRDSECPPVVDFDGRLREHRRRQQLALR